jgi:hypothetical protein
MVDPDLDDIIPMVPTKRIRGRVAQAEAEAAIEPETPCTHVPDPEESETLFAPPTPALGSPKSERSRSHSRSRKGHPASVKRSQKKAATKR